MDTTRSRALAYAFTAMLLSAPAADALAADYDFSITYSGMTISGRIVGLTLDMAGNATAADPTSVLLYQVPNIVGLPASGANPYVLTPYWYGSNGSQAYTSTPGVFGFNVSNFQILPSQQNLLLADAGFDVFMEFNHGTISTGINWGIAAQESAIWPAQDTTATFTLVGSVPGPVHVPVPTAVPEPSTAALSTTGALVVGALVGLRRRRERLA